VWTECSTGKNLELDIYIHELKLVWEVQGLHHDTLRQKTKDEITFSLCLQRGINLIQVWGVSSIFQQMKKMARVTRNQWQFQ
jgi:very-short-patch-repair endonuclease